MDRAEKFAIIKIYDYMVEGCSAGIDFATDIAIEITNDLEKAKQIARKAIEKEYAIREVIVVPALFYVKR